jgi:hypothetical protein
MIEKQPRSLESKQAQERSEPLRHVPVPKDRSEEQTDPEVIERLRSCH